MTDDQTGKILAALDRLGTEVSGQRAEMDRLRTSMERQILSLGARVAELENRT